MLVALDSRRVELERAEIRCPANGNEEHITDESGGPVLSFNNLDRNLFVTFLDPFCLSAQADVDSVALEASHYELRNIDIFHRQNLSGRLQNRNLYTESLKRLPKLATDWAAAEHDHAFRLFIQLVENCFVREIRDAIDAFDFWNRGAAAGGEYEISGTQLLTIDFDFVRRNKSRFTSKNINAQRFEAFLRIVRRDFGAT